MKLLDIALKDLYRSFRNAMFLVFGLLLPLLISGLFYFAFGGIGSGDGEFELPPTRVFVVNLDQPQGEFSAGELLVDVLRQAIPGVILVTEGNDSAAARDAVDRQQAAVAVIIPAGFTVAALNPQGRAAVELYQDPTLTLGPGIVKTIISGVVDGLAGSKIAASAAYDQLSAHGMAVGPRRIEEIAMQYAAWTASLAASGLGQADPGAASTLFDLQRPSGGEQEPTDPMASVLGQIMAGMMVFYVFFTGAATAQSILQEEESGTLPRLFTTPTAHSTILGGKYAAAFVLLTVQVVVLVVVSSLIFSINWGPPMQVALVTVSLAVLAASFGIFITSLLKNTRQSGIIYGGVMTVMGMIGMIGVFTAGAAGTPSAVRQAALVVPQGWAVRGWQLLLDGAAVEKVLVTAAVMMAAGIAFFAIGILRFQKRYA